MGDSVSLLSSRMQIRLILNTFRNVFSLMTITYVFKGWIRVAVSCRVRTHTPFLSDCKGWQSYNRILGVYVLSIDREGVQKMKGTTNVFYCYCKNVVSPVW